MKSVTLSAFLRLIPRNPEWKRSEAMKKKRAVAMVLAVCCIRGAVAQTDGTPKNAATLVEPSKSFDG